MIPNITNEVPLSVLCTGAERGTKKIHGREGKTFFSSDTCSEIAHIGLAGKSYIHILVVPLLLM